MTKELKNKIDITVKVTLVAIIIILLIHNCTIMKGNQNNVPRTPNGNIDIIEIKCDNNKCQPVVTPTSNPLKPTVSSLPVPKIITGLSFTESSVSVKKGDSLTLVVKVTPVELSDAKLSWKSSDSSIVSVDSNGVITAHEVGTVTITVTSPNGKTATLTVNVTTDTVEVKKITLNSETNSVNVGSYVQIVATIEPANATNRDLIWYSSDPSVARVDSKGLVEGLKAGTVTITAMTKDGTVKGIKVITIKELPTPTPTIVPIITPTITPTPLVIESLSFTDTNVSVKKGNTLQLVVKVIPTELSGTKLTWKSSNSNIVSVDENGKITGLEVGTATITVTSSNGKTATCEVTVTTDTIAVTKITLSSDTNRIDVDSFAQITAKIEPANATDRELIWSSSDPSIATVDSKGLVKGLKPGTVTITATTKDGKVKGTITITVKEVPTPTPTATPSPTPTPTATPDNDDGTDTFKVYDEDYTPVQWNGSNDLRIFSRSIYDVDGVIAPEYSNTYQFVVKNSTEYTVKYNIKFFENNIYHINMKYKLKRNDTYVIDHYVSFDELNISEQILNSKNTDVYYLEWKWVSSSNDTSIGQNPEAKYGLRIEVEAESINE